MSSAPKDNAVENGEREIFDAHPGKKVKTKAEDANSDKYGPKLFNLDGMQEMVLNLGPTPDPNDGLVQLLQKRCNTTDWQAIRNAILGGPIPNTFFDQKFPTKEELMAERVAQIERMSEESAKDLATTSKEHLEQQDLTEEGHRKRMRVHAGKTNEGDMDVNMEG